MKVKIKLDSEMNMRYEVKTLILGVHIQVGLWIGMKLDGRGIVERCIMMETDGRMGYN